MNIEEAIAEYLHSHPDSPLSLRDVERYEIRATFFFEVNNAELDDTVSFLFTTPRLDLAQRLVNLLDSSEKECVDFRFYNLYKEVSLSLQSLRDFRKFVYGILGDKVDASVINEQDDLNVKIDVGYYFMSVWSYKVYAIVGEKRIRL